MKKVLLYIYAVQTAFATKAVLFNNSIKKNTLLLTLLILSTSTLIAQTNNDSAYKKTIEQRSLKIVDVLGIIENEQAQKVQDIISQQYFNLNTIHTTHNNTLNQLKQKQLSNEEAALFIKNLDSQKINNQQKLHINFINALAKNLSVTQIEKVKDGMTYSVVPKTWAAYLDMLPSLTQEQKDKMYNWLVEARELAMDEGTSDKKHAVFGKYKGKINNYLSAAGYDMKKEGEEWAKRIKEAKEKATQN